MISKQFRKTFIVAECLIAFGTGLLPAAQQASTHQTQKHMKHQKGDKKAKPPKTEKKTTTTRTTTVN
jgi:hypothetical protein